MAKEKVVVAKRGCTCCGTGCVIPALVVPTVAFTLSGVVGALVAVLLAAPLTLGAMHALAFVSRRSTDGQMAE